MRKIEDGGWNKRTFFEENINIFLFLRDLILFTSMNILRLSIFNIPNINISVRISSNYKLRFARDSVHSS